jgi:lipopolysaccharide export LptBFGC system permease protein LptF
MRLGSLILWDFGRFAILCAAILYFVIGAGQLVQISRIVGGLDQLIAIGTIAGHAFVALSEVVLPLACLFAATILCARLRADGSALGIATSGVRPRTLLIPIAFFSLIMSGITATLAHWVVPESIRSVGDIASQAASESVLGDALTKGRFRVNYEVLENSSKVYWATLEQADRPALLLRSKDPRLNVKPFPNIELSDVRIWSPDYQISVKEVTLRLDGDDVARRLRMFGPPNALVSSELDLTDPHHNFTFHRRSTIPLMAAPWAILGGALGLLLSGVWAILLSSLVVALGYWTLRGGELWSRAGGLPPEIAAWAPLLLTLGLVLVVLHLLDRQETH